MQVQTIRQLIEAVLPDARVTVITEDNVHFEAIVIAKQFSGLSLLKRQQMVYGALNDHILQGELHALSLKTLTLEEWAEKNG